MKRSLLSHARAGLAVGKYDYNHHRPHSADDEATRVELAEKAYMELAPYKLD